MAYATVEQYEARYGEVDDQNMLQECLDDATAAIDIALDRYDIEYADQPESFTSRLMRVCRAVANRLMPAGSNVPAGVTQLSMTSGSYNENVSFTPSYGLPKLLPSELSMLGLGGTRGRTLMPNMADFGGDDDVREDL